MPAAPEKRTASIVLTGNPNCGKTTLFNALTGLRARVGNYAGVTVERKEGRLKGAPPELLVTVLDLPGTYSLSPQSLDEQIARDVLFHRLPDVPAPDLVVVVVDASNLERNLYYATQVIELGYPTLIALNMVDVAAENGHELDAAKLSKALGVPVQPIVASAGEGLAELRANLLALVGAPRADAVGDGRTFLSLPDTFQHETDALAGRLTQKFPARPTRAAAEALLLLTDEKVLRQNETLYGPELAQALVEARQRLEAHGFDWRGAPIEARYACVSAIQQAVVSETRLPTESFSDKLDRLVTHRVWGTMLFVVIMAFMFQSIFTFAKVPMDFLAAQVDSFGGWVGGLMEPGDLNELLVKGVIKGVGAVVVFLPQILLLFLFISLLEDTGYMARAAFLMDRLMSRVGLHGKSFIPMLSSFACAIPGIMATRTIESPKDRLVTILVAPLMSCSARLPVYTVLIAACIPDLTFFGFLKLSGLTMLAMYLLGIVVALGMAWLFKKTLLKSGTPMLIMELPPYKRPVLKVTLRHMWDRSKLFLRRAGTVILGINILLWFLATYPRDASLTRTFAAQRTAAVTKFYPELTEPPAIEAKIAALSAATPDADAPTVALAGLLKELDSQEAGERLRSSFAGRLGQFIEPAIAPLGFDWKMGIGLVASFAAREVFVSTMSVVYNVGDYDKSDAATTELGKVLQSQRRPDGSVIYTPLVAVTLMVFYVFALQCVSTIAVVRRETNSWKWPALQWAYMGALAWSLAFATKIIGTWLGG